MKSSKMQLTTAFGAEFWNDSCAPHELKEAVENGAVGATSNPVIVYSVVHENREKWTPVLDKLIRDNGEADEDAIAWKLIEVIGKEAAATLEPVYKQTKGKKGFLSMQVNPKFYRNPAMMAAHARSLAAIAPNIAIKVPATEPGLAAMEEIVSGGINVNATVSFSVAQAVTVAETFEKALKKAKAGGIDMSRMHPYVTIMVGRVDDLLKKALEKEDIAIDPGYLNWAGVAVFKKAYQVFGEKKYRSTLLAAAYRHVMHWSELIGEDLILSIPYKWWKKFNASDVVPAMTIKNPVDDKITGELYRKFADFRKAYDVDGMKPADFARYGASVSTLNQFLGGYQKLLELVRERMLA
ncbi:MAG: transaldolase family protein [Elusimicrobia bacterium]|nr:transaldolase family protein [Candidatus Obscuribacterium magneticum]